MNLCNDGHDEVCYESFNCPACAAIKDLKEQLSDAEKELEDVQKGLGNADRRIAQLEEETGRD